MNRRQFVNGAIAGGAFWANPRDTRPNIFFAIADDLSWIHTGVAGDPVVKTPVIDRIAAQGVRFTHSCCNSPSCTPSRAAVLTGQHIWRLKESGNLWSTLRKSEFPVYPDLLEAAGYEIGLMRKGWGPGDFKAGGFARNPAGPDYKSFAEFLKRVPGGKPFCFWFGTSDPHRPYDEGSGAASGMKLSDVRVPEFLPDVPEIRNDIADYLLEVQRFDREVGEALGLLEKAGKLDNTIVVVTSDNGMPWPRAKTSLYDYGVRMPLVIQWRDKVKGGRVVDDFVNHVDFAPTFLEACGVKVPAPVTGRSLLPLLRSGKSGRVEGARDHTIFGKERHTPGRPGRVGYPQRAIRTHQYLYIRNYEPGRYPSGDPDLLSDIDGGPTKTWMLKHRSDAAVRPLYDLACAKRPAEELYDVSKDPFQMTNLAGDAAHERTRRKLSARLRQRLAATADPRETGGELAWDKYEYYGPPGFDLESRPGFPQ